MKADKRTIVIAWVERTGPRRDRLAPHACVWLLEGTDQDMLNASEHLRSSQRDAIRRGVYGYPIDEPDPLGRAKDDILSRYKESRR